MKAQSFQGNRNRYFEIQKRRPNTIRIALEDNPVGLLAWDEYPQTDDEVCEWVSLYWFNRS